MNPDLTTPSSQHLQGPIQHFFRQPSAPPSIELTHSSSQLPNSSTSSSHPNMTNIPVFGRFEHYRVICRLWSVRDIRPQVVNRIIPDSKEQLIILLAPVDNFRCFPPSDATSAPNTTISLETLAQQSTLWTTALLPHDHSSDYPEAYTLHPFTNPFYYNPAHPSIAVNCIAHQNGSSNQHQHRQQQETTTTVRQHYHPLFVHPLRFLYPGKWSYADWSVPNSAHLNAAISHIHPHPVATPLDKDDNESSFPPALIDLIHVQSGSTPLVLLCIDLCDQSSIDIAAWTYHTLLHLRNHSAYFPLPTTVFHIILFNTMALDTLIITEAQIYDWFAPENFPFEAHFTPFPIFFPLKLFESKDTSLHNIIVDPAVLSSEETTREEEAHQAFMETLDSTYLLALTKNTLSEFHINLSPPQPTITKETPQIITTTHSPPGPFLNSTASQTIPLPIPDRLPYPIQPYNKDDPVIVAGAGIDAKHMHHWCPLHNHSPAAASSTPTDAPPTTTTTTTTTCSPASVYSLLPTQPAHHCFQMKIKFLNTSFTEFLQGFHLPTVLHTIRRTSFDFFTLPYASPLSPSTNPDTPLHRAQQYKQQQQQLTDPSDSIPFNYVKRIAKYGLYDFDQTTAPPPADGPNMCIEHHDCSVVEPLSSYTVALPSLNPSTTQPDQQKAAKPVKPLQSTLNYSFASNRLYSTSYMTSNGRSALLKASSQQKQTFLSDLSSSHASHFQHSLFPIPQASEASTSSTVPHQPLSTLPFHHTISIDRDTVESLDLYGLRGSELEQLPRSVLFTCSVVPLPLLMTIIHFIELMRLRIFQPTPKRSFFSFFFRKPQEDAGNGSGAPTMREDGYFEFHTNHLATNPHACIPGATNLNLTSDTNSQNNNSKTNSSIHPPTFLATSCILREEFYFGPTHITLLSDVNKELFLDGLHQHPQPNSITINSVSRFCDHNATPFVRPFSEQHHGFAHVPHLLVILTPPDSEPPSSSSSTPPPAMVTTTGGTGLTTTIAPKPVDALCRDTAYSTVKNGYTYSPSSTPLSPNQAKINTFLSHISRGQWHDFPTFPSAALHHTFISPTQLQQTLVQFSQRAIAMHLDRIREFE